MPAKDSLYLTVLVSINGSTGGNIPLGAQLETSKKASKSREIRKIKKHEKRKKLESRLESGCTRWNRCPVSGTSTLRILKYRALFTPMRAATRDNIWQGLCRT